jgi:Erg28 like protein
MYPSVPTLTPVIPPTLLGKWLLLVSVASIFNSLQNLFSLKLTQKIYSLQPTQGPPASGPR